MSMMRIVLTLLVGAWWLLSLLLCIGMVFEPPESFPTDNRYEVILFMLFNSGFSSACLFYVLFGKHRD